MDNYIKRLAEKTINRYLQSFPVIGITGPRQSGKSTLLMNYLPNYTYVTFDDPSNIESFNLDPKGFIAQFGEQVIFDEVQYVPEIFNYIKMIVDLKRTQYGQYVLTGSSQFSAMKKVSESLAGRMGLFSLLPLQYSELPLLDKGEAIFQGSYPELVARQYENSDLWYSSYIDTYLNKDVRVLSNIGDMRDFQRLISLLAARTSQVLDMSHYAKELGVSVPTVKRWLSILEASYIIFFLMPYYDNLGKRLIKSPKVYFWDTGLVSYLTGIKNRELYQKGPMGGSLFENYIVSELYKKQLHLKTGHNLFYLRTRDKLEVDLVLDKFNEKEFIEIKKSSTYTPRMISPLKQLMGENDKGYLLYQGKTQAFNTNIKVLNFADYLLL